MSAPPPVSSPASAPVSSPASAPVSSPAEGKFAEVRALVREIPRGRVTTYGRLAARLRAAGTALTPRAAGWALRHCPPGVPWHRVVNAEGALSAERSGQCANGRQRTLLEREGVRFDEQGRVLLDRHLWPGAAAAETDGLSAPPEDFE